MAEKSTPMSEDEISILKETLCAQQQLLQKLYHELDAEREASATSASEALSVILRLQGEKSAVKMEAEQYKRMAEEKMCHAEESFAIIEDIIYQKEMEVAALDYQVQSYKYKLLSMGCTDLGGGEIKYPENLLQRGESVSGGASVETRRSTETRRSSSTPILNKYKKALVVDRERSLSPEPDYLVFKNAEAQSRQEINDLASELDKRSDMSIHGGIASYMDEIRRLDTRVKSIAGANYGMITRPPSPRLSIINNPFVANEVHDVFEVPQVGEKRTDEVLDVAGKDEPDWLKKLFQSTSNEKNLCKPSHIAAIDRGVVQVQVQPAAAVTRPVFNLGSEVWAGTSEIERAAGSSLREEEVKLMKEIKEELNLLKEEIVRSRIIKRSSAREEECLHSSLPEAMLHFWL